MPPRTVDIWIAPSGCFHDSREATDQGLVSDLSSGCAVRVTACVTLDKLFPQCYCFTSLRTTAFCVMG